MVRTVRRSPLAIAAGLCLSSGLLAFVSPSLPAQGRVLPTDGVASLRARSVTDRSQPALVGFALACCSLAVARRVRRSSIPRKAEEDEEEESMPSILGVMEQQKAEQEEEENVKEEGKKPKLIEDVEWDDLFDNEINEQDLQDFIERGGSGEEASASDLAKRGKQKKEYVLYPSPKYTRFLACQKVRQVYKDRSRLEFFIALNTEGIRSLVMHCRAYPKDARQRIRLQSIVSKRRQLLDKLAWKDLDAYLKIRSELKIQHFYRMEALIGRWKPYVKMMNRMPYPGKKTMIRLKKKKSMFERRLAKQLRQGKDRQTIFLTKKRLQFRQWMSRSYDETVQLIKDKPVTTHIELMNRP